MTARTLLRTALLALVAAMWAAALASIVGVRDTAIVVLTAAVCWLVVRDRLTDAYHRVGADHARQERAAMQASGDWDRPDLDAVLREQINAAADTPLRLAWSRPLVEPADDTDPPIYLDALAWAEAARADWDEPSRWRWSE